MTNSTVYRNRYLCTYQTCFALRLPQPINFYKEAYYIFLYMCVSIVFILQITSHHTVLLTALMKSFTLVLSSATLVFATSPTALTLWGQCLCSQPRRCKITTSSCCLCTKKLWRISKMVCDLSDGCKNMQGRVFVRSLSLRRVNIAMCVIWVEEHGRWEEGIIIQRVDIESAGGAWDERRGVTGIIIQRVDIVGVDGENGEKWGV